MTSPASQAAQAARGLELMARHRNLVHAVVEGEMDVEKLLQWMRSLSDENWHLLAQAEEDAARYLTLRERRELVKAYDDAPMAGRAR